MKIDKYFHLYGRKDDVVFEEIPAPSAQPDIARDIATILENEQDMRVIAQNAQPERKKGKWVRHGIGHENVPWGFDCSACGEWFVIGDDTAERYNFCPNCGARMDEVTE